MKQEPLIRFEGLFTVNLRYSNVEVTVTAEWGTFSMGDTFPNFVSINSGAPSTQKSAGTHSVCCATRTASAQLAAESALQLAPRLRDFGVRKRGEMREKTREDVVIFV